MKILALLALLLLFGCADKPLKTWFEYEATTSKCAKLTEYKDRIDIELINCRKVPEGRGIEFRTVNKFGEDPSEEEE
jgi:hypothetical protein